MSSFQFLSQKQGRFLIQPRLSINKSTDIYEQEADAMADRVMRMATNETMRQPQPTTGLIGKSVQRKCSKCEEEEKKKPIMRKAENGAVGIPVSSSFASSLNASKGGGSPLPSDTRNFMEHAFSVDFSQVRVHTNNQASELSKGINAKAFTTGNDIYFNEGEYNPTSADGKHLLAHELTHTIHQQNNLQSIQRNSVYSDTTEILSSNTDDEGNNIFSGSVLHSEYRNENDRIAKINAIRRSHIGLRYNESTCQLVVPLKIQFINQTAGFETFCGNISGTPLDAVRPVSPEVFNDVKRRFLDDVPESLNGWYSVQLEEDSCSPCQTVPVIVEFSEVTSSADKIVIITGNIGRSYVLGNTIALCGERGQNTDTLIHEAGHFALGAGDEYHERQEERPVERERLNEYSRMAQDAPPRLLEFHNRHFAFAATFLKSIYPACNPRLQRTRSGPIEFTIPIGVNIVSTSSGQDLDFSLGLQLGIPLAQMRRLSLMLGPNFSFLVINRSFLVGFRGGIEGRIPTEYFGTLGLRGFGEAGLQFDFSMFDSSPSVGAYVGGGVGVDFRFQNILSIGLEAAAGSSGIGLTSESDYLRLGLRMGVSF